jgi:hypothetical protein
MSYAKAAGGNSFSDDEKSFTQSAETPSSLAESGQRWTRRICKRRFSDGPQESTLNSVMKISYNPDMGAALNHQPFVLLHPS